MDGRALAFLGAFLLILPACGGDHRSAPSTFSGIWTGHTRRLIVGPDGRGREIVDSGCCHRAITARFRVLHVSGNSANAEAAIRFTYFWSEKGAYRRPPRAGDVATLRLRHGVVSDEATMVTFCAINVDKCGL